jgi:hypothetical protein
MSCLDLDLVTRSFGLGHLHRKDVIFLCAECSLANILPHFIICCSHHETFSSSCHRSSSRFRMRIQSQFRNPTSSCQGPFEASALARTPDLTIDFLFDCKHPDGMHRGSSILSIPQVESSTRNPRIHKGIQPCLRDDP